MANFLFSFPKVEIRLTFLILMFSTIHKGRGMSLPNNISIHPFFGDFGEVQCANIFNIYDKKIVLGQNETRGNLTIFNFIPSKVQLRRRSVLYMIDDTKNVITVESSVLHNEVCWTRPITFAHCESCFNKTPSSPSACAIMYEEPYCATYPYLGVKNIEVSDFEQINFIDPDLDKRISSLRVKYGCELEIYKGPNFQGDFAIAEGTVDKLDYDWNDQISSYRCRCSDTPSVSVDPSYPSTRRVGTTEATYYPTY